jgi:hypothetical protein
MSLKLPNKNQEGQILLSILIALAVFAILSHAVFTLISSSFDLVSFNKARITARHLAEEQLELIRNLPYSDVGTVGGIPSGILNQSETKSVNGLNYKIKTSVTYIDDPFDDTAPADTAPDDYKRARVEVSWEGLAASKKNPIVLISDITANTYSSVGGGTLTVLVLDANGEPVPQAQVTIFSDTVTPTVDLTLETDSSGQVVLPGATPCVSCYHITATKIEPGITYSTDRTYSTSEVTNPSKPDASVFDDDVSQVTLAIDVVGTINVSSLDSRENNFVPLGNVSFQLRGNKIIGTDAYAQPVYKYDQTLTTDGSGNLNLSDMEWDVYRVQMPTSTTYDISATQPLLPLILSPSGSIDFTFAASPHSDHSLFVTAQDTSLNLIASASARLYDDVGFDETKPTGSSDSADVGQVLFSNLEEKTYHLEATASGYFNFIGDFDVSGYTTADVVLTPN